MIFKLWAQVAVATVFLTLVPALGIQQAPRAEANANQAELTASTSEPGIMFPTSSANFSEQVTESFNRDSLAAGTPLAVGTISTLNSGSVTAQGATQNETYTLVSSPVNTIAAAGWYGGSGGVGSFASVGTSQLQNSGSNVGGLQINLNTHTGTSDNTYRYIGFWWSGGNNPNIIRLVNDGVVQATFSAANLISQLGSAVAGTCGDYFGNPSRQFNSDGATPATGATCPTFTEAVSRGGAGSNEPYAFIHLRLSTGFDAIQIIGRGFEFDELTIRRFVPPSENERAIVGAGIVTTCANLSGNQTNLTACPRSVTIQRNTNAIYPISPLLESQIPGYTYPNGTTVSQVQLNSGSGNATLSGNEIRLSSNTIGTFQVIYTLSGNNQTSRSTIVVTVEDISTQLPNILIADPRSRTLTLPSQDLLGSVNAMICIEQVADSSGTALSGSPTVVAGRSTSVANVTSATTGNIWQFTGSLANVETQIPTITISGSGANAVVSAGSKFVRIGVTAASAMGSAACYTGVNRVVEIRALDIRGSVTKSVTLD